MSDIFSGLEGFGLENTKDIEVFEKEKTETEKVTQ